MPVPGCFDYGLVWGIVIPPTLFFLKIAAAFQGHLCFHINLRCFFYICEIGHWYFNGDCIESIIALGSVDILMMLILPVHEHGKCAHLFVSSLISFFSVVLFSEYRSFTSLVRFIPRYFIFLVAIANGIFFPISDSDLCFWYIMIPLISEYWLWTVMFCQICLFGQVDL